jgi:hypothetical protein
MVESCFCLTDNMKSIPRSAPTTGFDEQLKHMKVDGEQQCPSYRGCSILDPDSIKLQLPDLGFD